MKKSILVLTGCLVIGFLVALTGCTSDSDMHPIGNTSGNLSGRQGASSQEASKQGASSENASSQEASNQGASSQDASSQDASSQEASKQGASSQDTSSHSISDKDATIRTVNREGIQHIIVRQLVSKADNPAGQKDVTAKNDIQKILNYIETAPKINQVVYNNDSPGTIFNVECPETNYTVTVYRENILSYGGAHFKMDNSFTEGLLQIYRDIDAPSTDIQY